MPKKYNRIRETVLDLLVDTLGCAIFGIAIHVFIAPNQMAPGGVSGLSVVLHHLVPQIQIGLWSFLLNVPLLLIGLRFLGRKFTIKTMITVFILSVMIDYVAIYLPEYTGDPLLASLFSGALMGSGLSVVYMRGATTGGTDIIMRLMQLRFPHLQTGKILLSIDVMIILLSAVVFGRIETALYGMVAVFTSSRVVDSILYGMDTGKLVYVMSTKSVEISREVMTQLQRGCTLLNSVGAFTQQTSQVLLVAVRQSQYFLLKRLIRDIDPNAFIIVTDSTEVVGQGFKSITNEK